MNMPTNRRSFGFVLIMALAIFLAACSGDGGQNAKLIDANPDTTVAPQAPAATQAPASATPTSVAPSGNSGKGNGATAKCPTVVEASMLIAGNESALVREGGGDYGTDACLFEFRRDLAPSNMVTCPDGWGCELDKVGPHGYYYFGGGGQHAIDAGSFRLVAAYPQGDPIHTPCAALENSRGFLKFEGAPASFQMLPGNFSCGGTSAPNAAPTSSAAPAAPEATQCPTSPDQVASLLGGKGSNWKPEGKPGGWVYNGPKVSMKHPGYGKIDYDGGTTRSGSTPAGIVFTFWCKG